MTLVSASVGEPGDGAGMLGLTAIAVAADADAAEVIALDVGAERLGPAGRFGATGTWSLVCTWSPGAAGAG